MIAPAGGAGHRGTILLEQGRVLSHLHFDGEQHVLRLSAPRCAARATPGSFVHLRCAEQLPMRRPLSIMRADAADGWIELLYKVTGAGTRALAAAAESSSLSVLGPIGTGFSPHPQRPRALAIGGGVGIPPMVFLAERLLADARSPGNRWCSWVRSCRFRSASDPRPSWCRACPTRPSAACRLLDEMGVPSRLATRSGYAGCYDGFVTDLARAWLGARGREQLAEIELFACGPTPMLAATARLAREFALPCQVALEEFMACAVGGCAGCTVAVRTAQGTAMQRVCVDGPVFDAAAVFPG